jgi:GT2 family glycosyltransferase
MLVQLEVLLTNMAIHIAAEEYLKRLKKTTVNTMISPNFLGKWSLFFYKKRGFNQLGGFDESFFAHQEEIDLCWRSKNAGYKTYYTFQSIIYHVGGATLKESNPKKTFLNFRNSLLMLVKNLPKGKFYLLFLLDFFSMVLQEFSSS